MRSRIFQRFAPTLAALGALVPSLGAAAVVLGTLLARDTGALAREGRFALADLLALGLKDDLLVDAGEVGRLVTAGLVHVSPTHFLVNALGLALGVVLLWRMTPRAHRDLRRAGLVLALIVLASTAGFIASWLSASGPSGGASGAVFGLLGALPGALLAEPPPLSRRALALTAAALAALGLGAALALLGQPGVDHAAHLGGWAGGLVGGLALRWRAGRVTLAIAAVGLVTLGALT